MQLAPRRMEPTTAWWLFVAIGLGLAVALTAIMRTADAASVGILTVCSLKAVPEPEFPNVLATIAFEPFPTFFVVAIGVGYGMMVRTARRTGRGSLASTRRVALFYTGLALVFITLFGPMAAYMRTFLTVHMVQHFILITIAPPLLLAGAPLTLALATAGPSRRKRFLTPILDAQWFHRFTNPVVGIMLFAIVPVSWYTTPAFEESLTNEWVHYLGYAVFLLAGIHYWWPLIDANPTRWHLAHPLRLLYLFALVPIHAFLGSIFYEPSSIIFEELATIPRAWGPAPLLDQQIAGAFMFVFGEALGIVAMLLAAMQWSNADDRQAKRDDRARAKQRAAEQAATNTPGVS